MAKLLFTAFSNRPEAVDLARQLSDDFNVAGIPSAVQLLDDELAFEIDDQSLIVSLGGDGTFLKSARLAHQFRARVMAVNFGKLGFLLNVPRTEVASEIRHALDSGLEVNRLALTISFDGKQNKEFALNEVVVERAHSGRMVRVKTFVDNEEYLTYSADGVMVATPTGSTGYNFSAGGPVVDTELSLLIITPIAPHFTIERSIVVSDEKTIKLLADEKPAAIVADGQTIGALEPGHFIEVAKSQFPVRVVATRSFDLAFRLREGLQEGHA